MVSEVTPQVDCGRWPAKACVGDEVQIAATVARDGHEILRAVGGSYETGLRLAPAAKR